jgi:murein DD-endopeptidase MepM/ murein hydrolase activator NlpD
VSATKSELKSALEDKVALAGAVRELEEEVRDATQQRDSVRRAERALRWQVARLESQLQSADQDREVAQLWFKDWVAGNVASLQELFVDTGIDLEVMVARAVVDETGAGGPLQGVDAMNGFTAGQSDPITSQIRRLSALQKLASSMPLASPLDHFHVTSHYGKRSDPFTKRLAFHGGLDLGAAPGSTILATAPGRVVHAGISGPYGNMVEIDHGMGVSTRYGHLKSINVEMMQEIDFRQEIGVIGSTGRSTARHLHYEIRIDGKAYNPAKFLEAGRFLVDLFNFKHAGADGPTVQQTVTPAPKPKG